MLATLVFVLLVATSVMQVLFAAATPQRIFSAPFLVAIVVLAWILPQVIAIISSDGWPPGSATALLQLLLILLCTIFGWQLGYNKAHDSSRAWTAATDNQILIACVLSTAVGLLFNLWLNSLPIELTGVSMWTGLPTILVFFQKFQLLAYAISLLAYHKQRTRALLYLTLFNGVILFGQAVVNVRRENIVELLLITSAALWFSLRRYPSRTFLLSAAGISIFVVTFAGELRSVAFETDELGYRQRAGVTVEKLRQFDLTEPSISADPLYSEFGNAIRIAEAINNDLDFSYGLRAWDVLVFSYIPGQWIGFELKNALQVYDSGIPRTHDIETYVGSTITAVSDTLDAFWLFGSLIYLLIGFVYARWFKLAESGHPLYQALYCVCAVLIPLSITHGALTFVSRLPFIMGAMALLLYPWRGIRTES